MTCEYDQGHGCNSERMWAQLLRMRARITELEAAITDFADDTLGLQEVCNDKEELLDRVSKHCFYQRQTIEKLRRAIPLIVATRSAPGRTALGDEALE